MDGAAPRSKVLILDDEHSIADTLAIIFRMHGYEVQVAYSAEEALERMVAWHPDLALIDVMLPGISGIDLAIVLKQSQPWCQVLLFSGSESASALLELASRQGHEFEILAKPIHPEKILDAVRLLLATAAGAHALRRLS